MYIDVDVKVGFFRGNVFEKVGVEIRSLERVGGLGKRINIWKDEFLGDGFVD